MSHIDLRLTRQGTGSLVVDGHDLSDMTRAVQLDHTAGDTPELVVVLRPDTLHVTGELEVTTTEED